MLLAAGWVAAAILIMVNLLFWIGLTMILMAPFGLVPTGDDVAGVVVRAMGVGAGVLTLWSLRAELRGVRSACADCGRLHGRSSTQRSDSAPRWAYVAAHLAVAGLVVRMAPAVALRFVLAFDLPGVDTDAIELDVERKG